MKRMTLHELYTDLLRAYEEASRHKKNSPGRLAFELRFEEELDELARSMLDGTYAVRPCVCFVVSEPVMREVVAADFRDRVVHHYIHGYVNPFLERLLIHDCYSCREGKGTHFGVDRLEHHIRSCSQNRTRPCHVLQLDIRGYFMHIDRGILLEKVRKLMDYIGRQPGNDGKPLAGHPRHRLIAGLLETVVMHDPLKDCRYRGNPELRHRLPASKSLRFSPPGCGLPIGNLTSQLLSNLYLNDFDHYVKRVLRFAHYGRYVDDFYIADADRERLRQAVAPIRRYLKEELRLELHPDKIKLQEAGKGITFLGIHLKPHRRYLSTPTRKRIGRHVRSMNRLPPGALESRHVRRRLLAAGNSYMGVLNGTASFRLKKRIFAGCVLFRIAYGTSMLRKFVARKAAPKGRPSDLPGELHREGGTGRGGRRRQCDGLPPRISQSVTAATTVRHCEYHGPSLWSSQSVTVVVTVTDRGTPPRKAPAGGVPAEPMRGGERKPLINQLISTNLKTLSLWHFSRK